MDPLRDALVNINRRKFRSFLAIAGISVGIFVLLVIGSMASYFNSLSDHVRKTFAGRLFLCEKLTFWAGSGLISEEKLVLLSGDRRIQAFIPLLIGRLDSEEFVSLGMPSVLVGLPPESFSLYLQDAPLKSGSTPAAGGPAGVVAGHDCAMQKDLRAGDMMKIRGREFRVLGILEKTGSLEDRQILMPLQSAQAVLMRPHLLTCIIIIPAKGEELLSLAGALREKIPWAQVISARDLESEVENAVLLWDVLTMVCGLISGLASFLSVAVVMLMTVTERRREIGIKKALGAENRHIYAELFMEVILFSLLGWCLGMLLGMAFIGYYRHVLLLKGFSLFLVSPLLVLATLCWTILVGTVAAYFPLRQVLRIEPVLALRQV